MATDVEICSAALALLGAGPITSLTSPSPSDRETLCAELYPLARKYVLRAHPWNCAERRAWLTDPQIDPTNIDFTAEGVWGVTVRGTYVEAGTAGGNIAQGTTRKNSGTANYFEVEISEAPAVDSAIGVMTLLLSSDYVTSIGGRTAGWAYLGTGQKQGATVGPASYGDAWVKGDVLGVLWNATAGSLTFYRNGVSQGTAYASGVTGYLYPTVFVRSGMRVFLQETDWIYPPTGATAWPGGTLPAEYADYGYRLLIPNDCLRVTGVGDQDIPVDYRLKGRELMLDESNSLFVYVGDVPESSFDEMLTQAMVLYMAHLLAYPVTKSAAMRDGTSQQYERHMQLARNVDGQEQPMEAPEHSRLVASRFGAYR